MQMIEMHACMLPAAVAPEPGSADGFARVVQPVEHWAGRPLTGPGRARCLAAWRESPDGLRRVVADVLERAERGRVVSPLGLLVHLVACREHLAAVPAAPPDDRGALPRLTEGVDT
jgi:hypothetical protein